MSLTKCPVCGAVMDLFGTHTVEGTSVLVDYWCDNCVNAYPIRYILPTLRDDVSKNLFLVIQQMIQKDLMLLRTSITLTDSNIIAQQGLRWALADAQQRGLITLVGDFQFKLTLLGELFLQYGIF